jgi:hypothetical protein
MDPEQQPRPQESQLDSSLQDQSFSENLDESSDLQKKHGWFSTLGLVFIGLLVAIIVCWVVLFYLNIFLSQNNKDIPNNEVIPKSTQHQQDEVVPVFEDEKEIVAEKEDTKTKLLPQSYSTKDILLCDVMLGEMSLSSEDLLTIEEEVKNLTETDVRDEIISGPPSGIELCTLDAYAVNDKVVQIAFDAYIEAVNKYYGSNVLELDKTTLRNIVSQYEIEGEQQRFKTSAVLQSVAGLYPEVLICLEMSGSLSAPNEGERLCNSTITTWPELSKYDSSWGGCEVEIDAENYTFQYCATLFDDSIVICNEDGCSRN